MKNESCKLTSHFAAELGAVRLDPGPRETTQCCTPQFKMLGASHLNTRHCVPQYEALRTSIPGALHLESRPNTSQCQGNNLALHTSIVLIFMNDMFACCIHPHTKSS